MDLSVPVPLWQWVGWKVSPAPAQSSHILSFPRPGLHGHLPRGAAGPRGGLHSGAVPLPASGHQGSEGMVPLLARGVPALGVLRCGSQSPGWRTHVSHRPGGRPAPGGDDYPAGGGCGRVWLRGGGGHRAPDGAQSRSGRAPSR